MHVDVSSLKVVVSGLQTRMMTAAKRSACGRIVLGLGGPHDDSGRESS
jgi:hypothetical protein